jgi:multicopper oxidase
MHDDPMLHVRVGSMQHWRIVNSTSEVHPFHIHQIHFLAYAGNGIQSDSPEWLDTVNVPNGGTVDLIMDYRPHYPRHVAVSLSPAESRRQGHDGQNLIRVILTMNRMLAWMLIPRHNGSVVQRYGAAAVSVILAAIAALLLRHYNLPHPFTSFSFVAIATTFWYAGTGPGLLAIALSCSALTFFFTPLKIGNLPLGFLSRYLWSLWLSRELV